MELDAITGAAAYVGNDRLDILATNQLGRRRARHAERGVPHPLGRTRRPLPRHRFHATAVKHFHHPAVGELSLAFNRLDVAADHGLMLFTYTAEPGSHSEQALNLLGSWAATADLAAPARTTDRC